MPLTFDMLDVGQGDGLFLQLPNTQLMLIDLGSTKNKQQVAKDIWAYFRDHTPIGSNTATLEWLVLTHGDRDHYNLVADFLQAFNVSVNNVLHGGFANEYGGLIPWLSHRANPSNGLAPNVYTGFGTTRTRLGDGLGVDATCLACSVPSGGSVGHQKNARSVVLKLKYGGRQLLLTGDATVETENAIIAQYEHEGVDPATQLRSDVLKMAHHGSFRTSNGARWLSLVNPDFAFVSSDRSGTLDDDQNRRTGHRLPQELTFAVLRKYAPQLATTPAPFRYVSSFQRSDFTEYNAGKAIGDQLPIPVLPDLYWLDAPQQRAIFTTLVKLGIGALDPDVGAQWQVTVAANGDINVTSTEHD